MEAARLGLNVGVDLRDPPVLTHVLGPGLDEEPLDDPLRVRGILGNTPGIRTIPAPLLGEPVQGN